MSTSASTTTLIAKEFHWEMAHRLADHPGLCRNIHGHSYKLWLGVEGAPRADGMVLDFHDLREAVAPLLDRLDHAFLCDRADVIMAGFLEETGMKAAYLNGPPTTENLAAMMLAELMPALAAHTARGARLTRVVVRVHETERSYAEVTASF
jgi:6-pyruvoyltetrahydropterin/6-carboxytetrahydropterin synthase